jgi:hypothetical protein
VYLQGGSQRSYTENVEIDNTADIVKFSMLHNGDASNARITVFDPSGIPASAPALISQTDSSTIFTVFAESKSGTWTVGVENSGNLEFDYMVSSLASNKFDDYNLFITTTRAENAEIVPVDQNEVLQLYICRGSDFLTGVNKVYGTLYDANKNRVMSIEFVDDGDVSKGDAKAMDGIYSAIVRFPKDGLYSIEAALEVKDFPLRVTRRAFMPPKEVDDWEEFDAPFSATFSRTALLSVLADPNVKPLPVPTVIPDKNGNEDDDDPVPGPGPGCDASGGLYMLILFAALAFVSKNRDK